MPVIDSEPQSSAEAGPLRVLVADDRSDVLEALRLLLKSAGHRADTVDSPQALLDAAAANRYDLVLMDLNYARDTTSGQEGLDLLARLHDGNDPAPIVVMTAWGNVELAVEAMRRGAVDFVQKPWDNRRLLEVVQKQASQAARRRLEVSRARSELEIARQVQARLFPQRAALLATAECAGRCVPAHEVGGDYYDFLDPAPGLLGFLLADVSGKGIAAALLMANLQGCFRSHAAIAVDSPRALVCAVNRLFCDSTPAEQYATLFFGRYEEGTRRLRYVNCGHLAPILLRAGGAVERLEPTATVLGLFREWDCGERAVQLAPGDTLVIFSDGVTEAGIEVGEEFGEARLLDLIRARGQAPLGALLDGALDAARSFSAIQTDDVTLVGLRVL
ncbi:MAG: SpoIIE family protein phosphatase [Bryobacteraceae bacterium]|jgi:sigma-B regulation protein RsbU (phosphoserine phosphatase)